MRPAGELAPAGAIRAWFAIAALGALVAACAPAAEHPVASPAADSARGPAQASPAAGTIAATPVALTGELPVPAEPAPPRAEPAPFSLDRLRGLSADALEAALGEPTLLRRDGTAELWHYAGPGCVLHVYLYQTSGIFRVSYSEVRIDDHAYAAPPTCVSWKARAPASAESAAATDGSAASLPLASIDATRPGGGN